MKRTALSLLGCLTLATGVVFAQSTQQQRPPVTPQQQQQKPEVTLTGCVTQGSAPTVFILENARLKVDDKGEKGKSYMLVAAAEDLNFAKNVNHEVTVTGVADPKTVVTPPAGQKIEEKDLPKLSAKSMVVIADKCSPTR
jgi:hypothetical protein